MRSMRTKATKVAKVVTINDKVKNKSNIYQKCEEQEPTQCLKYYYDTEEEFENNNVPCGDRFWEGGKVGFEDITEYTPNDMGKYVETHFGNQTFGGDSPFAYHPDYKTDSLEKICNSDKFELKPQQKFAGKLISPETNFPGVLVYNGLGSGKTICGIVIGEAMKAKTVDNLDTNKLIKGHCPFRIYVVVPKAVKEQYYEEIIGKLRDGSIQSGPGACVITEPNNPNEGIRQFYVGSYTDGKYDTEELNRMAILERKIYEIGNNPTMKLANEEKLKNLEKELKLLRKHFHNIVNSVYHIVTHDTFINSLMYKDRLNGRYVPSPFLLTNEMFHSDKSLVIIDEIQRLVSDKGTRFYELFNSFMIYARNRNTGNTTMRVVLLTATPVYDNPHEAALMLNLLRPRIPFPLDRDTFNAYFIKDNMLINPILLKYICSGYVVYFKGGNPDGYPFRKNYIKIHPMGKLQEDKYVNSIIREIENEANHPKFITKRTVKKSIKPSKDDTDGIYAISSQKCNIAYNSKYHKTQPEDINDFKKKMNSLKGQPVSEILKVVENYSTKFADIVKQVIDSPGPVFIYTKWVAHGIIPLTAIFNAIGWSFLNQSMKTTPSTYAVWSPGGLIDKGIVGEGDIDSYIKNMRQLFNSPENMDGGLCKVLISNVVEGISLKRVNQVHVVEPWWNISKLEQIIARGIRLCSHADLPASRRYVDVFYHCSVLGSYPEYNVKLYNEISNAGFYGYYKDLARSTIDQKMFVTAVRKQSINNQFEQILKESAIDCKLNKQGNIIRLEETVIPSSKNIGSVINVDGNLPLYNRSNDKYYLLEKENDDYYLVLLDVLTEATLIVGKDKRELTTTNWPPLGIQRTETKIPLFKWQVTNPFGGEGVKTSVIVYEDIVCDINASELSKMNFQQAYNYAMKKGEDPLVWKYAHDAYIKMKLLGLLIVKYDMLNGTQPTKLTECLYAMYKNKNHKVWKNMKPKEIKTHINAMKNIFEKNII